MIESASIQNAKNYSRADMNRAMESVFAEYQKELLEDYDIFALEGSYETGHYSEDLLKRRLGYYGAGSLEHKVRAIEFLTDQGGRAFYRQAAAYMEHKYGLSNTGCPPSGDRKGTPRSGGSRSRRQRRSRNRSGNSSRSCRIFWSRRKEPCRRRTIPLPMWTS